MRRMVVLTLALVLSASACTIDETPPSAAPTPTERVRPPVEVPDEVEIYADVLRHQLTQGNGRSTWFKRAYVINGPVAGAGHPRTSIVAPPDGSFSPEITAGIEEQLSDLVRVIFVDADDPRLGRTGLAGVRDAGAIVSLGPIERKNGRVHVPNGKFCGSLCGQWLTYVLTDKTGAWKVVRTTGPRAIS